MTQTPLQQAIEEINKCLPTRTESEYLMGKERALFDVIDTLESLLPKEKEFVGNVWDEAILTSHLSDFDESHIIRDQYKNGFIKSLYGE